MLQNIDTWIKANPYVSKLIVAVITSVLGWFTHKYLGVDLPPVEKPPVKAKHVYGVKFASPELQAAVHAELGGHRVGFGAAIADKGDVGDTGPVLDQGDLGSCGPNALDSLLRKAGVPYTASRLFTYYETRKLMHTTGQDSGVINSQMVKAVHNSGFLNETEWPYQIAKFRLKPTAKIVSDAKRNAGVKFARVDSTVESVKEALAAGYPVLAGFNVYESFESADAERTGDIPMPGADEQLLGGHDIALVGWDDSTARVKFKNSWGEQWGAKGFGTLPYEYIATQGSDFWAIVSLK